MGKREPRCENGQESGVDSRWRLLRSSDQSDRNTGGTAQTTCSVAHLLGRARRTLRVSVVSTVHGSKAEVALRTGLDWTGVLAAPSEGGEVNERLPSEERKASESVVEWLLDVDG